MAPAQHAGTTQPRPNVRLTEIAPGFEPGDALDLGCGAGGDAIWLARQGWHVTAVDISAVAVERLTKLAADRHLHRSVTAERHDLRTGVPGGRFDLVSAHYLHTPFDLDRAAVFPAPAGDRGGSRTRPSTVDGRTRRRPDPHRRRARWRDRRGDRPRPDRAPHAMTGRLITPSAAVPSGTNLVGLLNHLAWVERATFLGQPPDDWQATFTAAPQDTVADVVARYRATVAQANTVLDGCTDLAAPLARPQATRQAPSVRWALTHMIEETGRHAGHADIVRELIDGVTGR